MRHLPVAAIVAAVWLLTTTTPAVALFEGTFTASECVSRKVACLAKMHQCLLKCHVTASGKGIPVAPACLARCRDALATAAAVPGLGCWAKAEAKGDCGAALGDGATASARMDAHVGETVRSLLPFGSAPANRCSSKKLTCVRKYEACVLKVGRTAAQYGTALGDLSRCTQLLDGSTESCVGKLEAKYCGPSCGSAAPLCQTFEDQGQIRYRDDTFIDEIIDGLRAGPRDVDTQRCTGDTAVRCTSAPGGVAGCGGPLGTCEFQVGAPTPQGWGGIQICNQSHWSGSLTGTFDSGTGAMAGSGAIVTRYRLGATLEQPCPVCTGDPTPNDGLGEGVCSGGAHAGAACDANQRSTFPTHGPTSLDCPPSNAVAGIATLPFTMANEGTVTMTVDAASPNCNGAPGKKCLCATCSLDHTVPCNSNAECALVGAGTCNNPSGEPRRPNACVDTTSTPGDGTVCLGTGDLGNITGVCSEGPHDSHCAIEAFRGCLANADCPATNDHCISGPRPCHVAYNGYIGDSVTAIGRHETPRNGAGPMTLAAVFCHPATDSSAANTVLSAPGPSRFAVTGIGYDDGGPSCPTRVSFVPTARGGAIDIGWNGLPHGQPWFGGAALTVAASCSGTYPDCTCTYTGPIANPNAP